jgi:hypothetical protein
MAIPDDRFWRDFIDQRPARAMLARFTPTKVIAHRDIAD